MQTACCLGDGNDEDEVEQQLERRGGAVSLVPRARDHRGVQSGTAIGGAVSGRDRFSHVCWATQVHAPWAASIR